MLYTIMLHYGQLPIAAAVMPILCLIIIQMLKEKRHERERA